MTAATLIVASPSARQHPPRDQVAAGARHASTNWERRAPGSSGGSFAPGQIKLSRPPGGRDGLRAYRVVVDGRPVAKLRRGRTCAIAVGPGRHRLYVRLDWWLRCPEVEVNLASGASGVFLCRPRGGVLDSLELVDSNPGAYLELIRNQ